MSDDGLPLIPHPSSLIPRPGGGSRGTRRVRPLTFRSLYLQFSFVGQGDEGRLEAFNGGFESRAGGFGLGPIALARRCLQSHGLGGGRPTTEVAGTALEGVGRALQRGAIAARHCLPRRRHQRRGFIQEYSHQLAQELPVTGDTVQQFSPVENGRGQGRGGEGAGTGSPRRPVAPSPPRPLAPGQLLRL